MYMATQYCRDRVVDIDDITERHRHHYIFDQYWLDHETWLGAVRAHETYACSSQRQVGILSSIHGCNARSAFPKRTIARSSRWQLEPQAYSCRSRVRSRSRHLRVQTTGLALTAEF